jgi:hypothetical protein
MKRIIAIILAVSMLTACGTPMDHGGKHYPTYGFFNEDNSKSQNMCYEVSIGNVIWSILLAETIVFPVYFIGWSLWEPVGLKVNGKCGIDKD